MAGPGRIDGQRLLHEDRDPSTEDRVHHLHVGDGRDGHDDPVELGKVVDGLDQPECPGVHGAATRFVGPGHDRDVATEGVEVPEDQPTPFSATYETDFHW